jgi:L-alanine-DL-glutamate epimerase-like enolase superfamily enzyme
MNDALATTLDGLDVSAYTVPTEDQPESDGTLQWNSTTMVLVEARADGKTGLGYSYTHQAAATLIDDKLAGIVEGCNALQVRRAWRAMQHDLRNVGWDGLVTSAVAAVDTALWDLKARLLELPLCTVLDAAHERVPIYGSGGFTSYSVQKLQNQLSGWVGQGIPRVKMKVGRNPGEDVGRATAARDAIGEEAELMIDANGAYARKQALRFGEAFADLGATWFEEPVSSDDLEGLRLLRDAGPPGLEITAGEYGYDVFYFRHMLEAGAVDCLQADATRCAGFTGFLDVAGLCRDRSLDLSAHTAPALHVHPMCAVQRPRHIEYFHDHVRIERMFFDGTLSPEGGYLEPDRSRPGNGLSLKREEAETYRIYP